MVKSGYSLWNTLAALFAEMCMVHLCQESLTYSNSCHNNMCEKEEHERLILKITLTPE